MLAGPLTFGQVLTEVGSSLCTLKVLAETLFRPHLAPHNWVSLDPTLEPTLMQTYSIATAAQTQAIATPTERDLLVIFGHLRLLARPPSSAYKYSFSDLATRLTHSVLHIVFTKCVELL